MTQKKHNAKELDWKEVFEQILAGWTERTATTETQMKHGVVCILAKKDAEVISLSASNPRA